MNLVSIRQWVGKLQGEMAENQWLILVIILVFVAAIFVGIILFDAIRQKLRAGSQRRENERYKNIR